MNVWLLESGDYSDRHLVGVFSTRENALKVKAMRADVEDHDPEEVEVDAMVEWTRGPTFCVDIEKPSGKVKVASWNGRYPDIYRHPSACKVFEDRDTISVVSPISEEHALKVATEKRQEWLRTSAAQP